MSADPLVVSTVEFLGPMATADGWRPAPGLPEIAFAGRSNVGKSSLLNVLVKRRKLARVSNTPGRTREINFFAINGRFTLVDLPGYGYARVSKTRKAEWRPLIEGYLASSAELRGVVQLLDARRDPSDDDLAMLDFLADLGAPTLVAATKVDKLRASERAGRLAELAIRAGVSDDHVIPFSAVTGEGRDALAESVVDLMSRPAWREQPSQVPATEP
ncbi:MAG TPA: ribosome biogenesis GTP-binding protein YihA/YsxC [Gemmatimonadaceae bacterium]|jgi:GTP-binding protein|nr:ribosome biogenesis GTP-binding protein YihA/YsxC [Gemmatimonadaceae bacterium]